MKLFLRQTNLLRIAAAILLISIFSLVSFAQHSGKPVLKEKLIYVIKTKALTEQEMITGIKKFGVNFELTNEVETEIRNAGASDAIIAAVKDNYLGADSSAVLTTSAQRQIDEPTPAYSGRSAAAAAPYSKADDMIGDGVADFAAGEYKSAIKKFEQAAKIDPANANAYFNLGEVYYETKKYSKSIEAFQKTLSLDPNFKNAQKELDDAIAANQTQLAADKEKQARSRAKWAAFGQLIDQIPTESQQTTAQSNGAQSASRRTAGSQAMASNRSAGGSPSEADVRAWVEAYEDEINPTGGVSSPISISLSFNQISYGAVRAANEGDRLRHVKSDQLYMVTVDYTVNQKFSDGTYPKHKKWNFEFYVNTENGWSAFSYGPAN